MRRIAFVSPVGGAGQTTLVANLASLWSTAGQHTLAVDLCPQNSLGQHLGQTLADAPDVQAGWADAAVAGSWWAQGCLANSAGVRYLPFGNGVAEATQATAFNRMLEQDPHWLGTQLKATTLEDDCMVLLDAPMWPHPLAQQALACADLVVVCLDTSPRSARVQPLLQALLAQARHGAAQALVATRFSPRNASRRAALEALQQQWPALSPYVQHEDENTSAALAAGQCVVAFAPQAQSAHDLHGLANWLLARCPQAGGA